MRIKTRYTNLYSSDASISLPDEIHVTKTGAVACHASSGDVAYPSLAALCEAYKLEYVPAFQLWLQARQACKPARDWIGDRDAATTWRECPRADWLLWALAELEIDRKLLVTATCRIARKVLHLVPKGDDRPRLAIEAAERWICNKSTIEEMQEARYKTWAGATNGAAYAAANAAAIVFYPMVAPAAADAAADAVTAESPDDVLVRTAFARDCADIVREVVPWETVEAALWA